YSFDFGDGSGSTGPQTGATASHSYGSPGSYTVTVTVRDSAGLSSSATGQVTVSGPPSEQPPSALLSVIQSSFASPLLVRPNASRSPYTTLFRSYSFGFGDGSGSTGPQTGATASHSYSSPGSYTVTVTVRDSGGLSSSATAQLTVSTNLVTNA